MFNGLLNFSFKEVAIGVVLSVLLIGGGVAAIVAFVPRTTGGEVSPPTSPTPSEVVTTNLQINQVEGGTVIADCGNDCEHERGWQASITAIPDDNYLFEGWECSGRCPLLHPNFSANSIRLVLYRDVILTPRFKIPTFEFVPDGLDLATWNIGLANDTLQANDYEVTLGESTGGLLNPLLNVYDEVNPNIIHTTKIVKDYRVPIYNEISDFFAPNPNITEQILYHHSWQSPHPITSTDDQIGIMYPAGTPGLPGVDVDRSSLKIVSAEADYGTVTITTDARNIRYIPSSVIATDIVRFTAETYEDDIRKLATATITVNLTSEDYAQNRATLNQILSREFNVITDSTIRSNFRFADGEISNEDLSIVQFFSENNFTDESVQIILGISETLSPIREIDKHTLKKLLAVERGLWQNDAFAESVHGFNNWKDTYIRMLSNEYGFWPHSDTLIERGVDYTDWNDSYMKTFRAASFIIPSFIEVIENTKMINYSKAKLDEIFPQIGGRYTGFFSRGEDYSPLYACKDDPSAILTDRRWAGEPECTYSTENLIDMEYKVQDPMTYLNELVIHFTLLSVLDKFEYTIGPKFTDRDTNQFEMLFDVAVTLPSYWGRYTGDWGGHPGWRRLDFPWEHATYDNGEVTNVYNLAREIIGDENPSEAQTLLKLMNWSIDYSYHGAASPNIDSGYNSPEERNKLLSLPNDNGIPSAWWFMLFDLGGVNFGGSGLTSDMFTSVLRTLNIEADSRWVFYNNAEIVIDGESWYFEGNFPFWGTNACNALIQESEITDDVITNYDLRRTGSRLYPDLSPEEYNNVFEEKVGVSSFLFKARQTEFCERYAPEVYATFNLDS